MRFSELNKARSRPEPEKAPKPAPAAPEQTAPAPAAELPRPETQQSPAPPPDPERAERAEAVRRHARAYVPSARADQRRDPPVPERPFRELDAQAREVYTRVMALSGELLSSINQPYTEKYEAICAAADLAAEALKTNNVLLNYTAYASAEDYLKAHSANVMLLALAMGNSLGLDRQEMKLLGFCALAHDIGMIEYADLYRKEAKLTEEDFSAITLHTESGVAKLDRIVDLDYKVKDRAKRIIFQTHERIDGSGYPDRLSSESIDPLAQLIGIADVFEAMTHPRSWREPVDSPDVIRDLIEKEGRGFTAKVVKALISVVSIYPPGSLVMLATGEIARVLKVNRGSLTRPLVETLLDSEFAQLQPQVLDLLEHPLNSVERPMAMSELRARNPKFAVKLELSRWWTDW